MTKEVVVEKLVTAEMMIPEGPLSGGTLRHSAGGGNTQDIFNPLKQVSSSQAYITDYVFLPLWYGDTWGPGDTPAMTGDWDVGVANRWEEVERARVYNFHINPDVKWHDGLPVTADDVLFGARLGLDKNYGSGMHKKAWARIVGAGAWGENPTDNIEDVEGLAKLDEMTVQVAIDRPDSAWWASRDWHLPPMAQHHYAGLEPATALETRATHLLGNGPMIWNRYVSQQFADMAGNKDFAYGAPYVDDYVVRYGDRTALDAAMEAGEQDFHRGSNIEAFQRLASLPHLRPFPQRSPFGGHVFFNQTAEVFADMTLEQQSLMIEAMVRAVDRDTVNNELHAGTLFISDYIFEHVALMQDPPEGTFRALPYDPDAARALVEEAQWDSEKVINWIKWGPPSPTDLALKNYWEQVGIKVEFFLVDGSAVIEKLYQERVHDMVMANMGGRPGGGGRVPARVQRPGVRARWLEPLEHQPPVDRRGVRRHARGGEQRGAARAVDRVRHATPLQGQHGGRTVLARFAAEPVSQASAGGVLHAVLRHAGALADRARVAGRVLGRAVAATAMPAPSAAA